jgi:glycerol-3-phosphate dehydrogenase
VNRDAALDQLSDGTRRWDVVVVGGGATGLGVGLDAASRGYKTLLVEQSDFAAATSSRSTKLIHGGVRYLRQGNIALVREALRERGLLLQNAPGLVRPLPFLLPVYGLTERWFYGAGLKAYDWLAGSLGLEPSRYLSASEVAAALPTLRTDRLRGGIRYLDGQFDDAALALSLARTMTALGGTALNYCRVERLLHTAGRLDGVEVWDLEPGGKPYTVRSRVVVNATGGAVDGVRRWDDPRATPVVTHSQGAHLVLGPEFLPGDHALMIPKTRDGRVLFAIPWQGRVLLGTTDTRVETLSEDPHPFPHEVEFLLEHAAEYLQRAPGRQDVLSAFAGVRPLLGNHATAGRRTASLSREHALIVSPSGLVTITGGKWTTYRSMAETTVNRAVEVGGLERRPCVTRTLSLDTAPLSEAGEPPLHPKLNLTARQVEDAVRAGMARGVADVLARRSRALFLDARASMEVAPKVAALMARALGKDEAWSSDEVRRFRAMAVGWLL